MMPLGNLTRMVVKNSIRSPKHFALSAFGIVIGIGSFVFFLALSLGVSNVVLGKIFPLDVVEVISPRTSFGGRDITIPLTDKTVEKLRAHPDVAEALPRMRLTFPAAGYGTFEGEEIKFEVGGFTDGIDPGHVAGDARLETLFKDWEAEPPGPACVPDPEYSQKRNTCPDKQWYYCDHSDSRCHRRVPVIVSPAVLEIYNSQIAGPHGLPIIDDVMQYMLERGADKTRFTIALGDTTVASTRVRREGEKRREMQGQLVGLSDKAMPIGMTIPIQYVRRWNLEFAGEAAANTYSSIIVRLRDKDRLAPFAAWLEENDLRLEDSLGERFATAIYVVTTLFIFISFTIVTISSINIAHNFFMQVSERRREIGVLRAVGATRTDVRLIILGEAALIGVAGGVLGVILAVAGAGVVDWASAEYLPRFPFKPKSYFDFEPWIFGAALGFSTVFCVLGGFLPARKASRIAPAQALAQN